MLSKQAANYTKMPRYSPIGHDTNLKCHIACQAYLAILNIWTYEGHSSDDTSQTTTIAHLLTTVSQIRSSFNFTDLKKKNGKEEVMQMVR